MSKMYKCPNCGATINIDTNSEVSTCEFCGTKFNTMELYDPKTRRRKEHQAKEEWRVKQTDKTFNSFFIEFLILMFAFLIFAICAVNFL